MIVLLFWVNSEKKYVSMATDFGYRYIFYHVICQTKCSIDITNWYNYHGAKCNAFSIFTEFYVRNWYKRFLTLILLKLFISSVEHKKVSLGASFSCAGSQ